MNPLTYFEIWIGAISCHVLSLYSKEFTGTISFLKKNFPKKTETFYNRCETILLPLIGMVVAYASLAPADFRTCFFAGFSWTGTVIALSKTSNKAPTSK